MGAIIVVLIIKFTHILHMNNIFFHVVKFNRLTINECLGMLVKSLWIKIVEVNFFGGGVLGGTKSQGMLDFVECYATSISR